MSLVSIAMMLKIDASFIGVGVVMLRSDLDPNMESQIFQKNLSFKELFSVFMHR